MNTFRSFTAALTVTLAGLTVHSGPAAAAACSGQPACAETSTFVARVTNFRTSTKGRYRVLTATVRFHNKTDKPLTLGYLRDSGIALDDLGNRYVVSGSDAVRGIGEIRGNTFDSKFTLQPGGGSDARFELSWNPGRAIVGTKYDLDMSVREVIPVAGDQFRFGAEHALHFAALEQASAGNAPGAAASMTTPAATTAATAAPTSNAPAATSDPCAGSPQCYAAGTFVAEILRVAPSNMGSGARHHTLMLNVRFRNVSDAPIVLAYRGRSSAGMDNFGNHYYWGRAGTHDTSAKGIGVVDGREADAQFVLQPGQSRNATFNLFRYNAKPPYGSTFSYDVVIDELELLAGQQVRSLRQNSLSFTSLTAGTFTDVSQSGGEGDAVDTANKVLDLFNRLKGK